MTEGSLSLESIPADDQTRQEVIKSLESQVNTLKEELDDSKRHCSDEKDRQTKVNDELLEKLREQHRKEKDELYAIRMTEIAKVKEEFKNQLDSMSQEKQDVQNQLTNQRMEQEQSVLDHQNDVSKLEREKDNEKSDMETELRKEITDLRRLNCDAADKVDKDRSAWKTVQESLEVRNDDMQRQFDIEKQEKELLMMEVQTLKGKLNDVENHAENLERDIEMKKSKIRELENQIDEKNKASLEGIGEDRRKEFDEMGKKAQQTDQDLKYWKERAEELLQENLLKKKNFHDVSETISSVQAENDDLRRENDEGVIKLKEQHHTEMDSVISECDKKLENQMQEASTFLTETRDRLTAENSQVRKELIESNDNLAIEHKNEIENLRGHFEELISQKDKQLEQLMQNSAGRFDEREMRLKEEARTTIEAKEQKISALETVIGQNNERLLSMRDALNKENIQALEVTREQFNAEKVLLVAEHERLRNEQNKINQVLVTKLEERIADMKAEFDETKAELRSDIARLNKEKEEMLTESKQDLQRQRDESKRYIENQETRHAAALETEREGHQATIVNYKESTSREQADKIAMLGAGNELRLGKAADEIENLTMRLDDEVKKHQAEINSLKKLHTDTMALERNEQKNLGDLLKENAERSSDEMIRFMISSHSGNERKLLDQLDEVKKECRKTLEDIASKNKDKVKRLQEEFAAKAKQVEERCARESVDQEKEWGTKEGQFLQEIKDLKCQMANLMDRNVKEESEEVERLQNHVQNLQNDLKKLKEANFEEVKELQAQFWQEKKEYENHAKAERATVDRRHLDAVGDLVKEVVKLQGHVDEARSNTDALREKLRSAVEREAIRDREFEDLLKKKNKLEVDLANEERERKQLQDQVCGLTQATVSTADNSLEDNQAKTNQGKRSSSKKATIKKRFVHFIQKKTWRGRPKRSSCTSRKQQVGWEDEVLLPNGDAPGDREELFN